MADNPDVDAFARMLETVDLLGKVTASISDRLDQQDRQIQSLTALMEECKQTIDGISAKTSLSLASKELHSELFGLYLEDLKQKTTDLKALYAEADRYFDRVKEGKKGRSWF